jgi:hypothetical protein
VIRRPESDERLVIVHAELEVKDQRDCLPLALGTPGTIFVTPDRSSVAAKTTLG